MIEKVLSEKIREYGPANAIEQESVLTELMHLFILSSLAKTDFFRFAEFHGGTFLRIIHGIHRFSEDLDFVLKKVNRRFKWSKYLAPMTEDCADSGIRFEVLDKSDVDSAVKKAFLKTDSVGKLLLLDFPYSRNPSRKIKIKLEIDTNPPKGSAYETSYISFPVMSAITTQTLESAFACKSHALLCRSYAKGRDWFDFLWFVSKKIHPNYVLLENALKQQGPWAGKKIRVTPDWFLARLEEAIRRIDWKRAVDDVRRFLPPKEQEALNLWSVDSFIFHTNLLGDCLRN